MDIEALVQRIYLEIARVSRDIDALFMEKEIRDFYRGFPYRWCKAAAYVVFHALQDVGAKELRCLHTVLGDPADMQKYRQGKGALDGLQLDEHVWVQAEGLHIDLTRGQFDDKPLYWEKPYIGVSPPFVPGCFYFQDKAGDIRELDTPPYLPVYDRFLDIVRQGLV